MLEMISKKGSMKAEVQDWISHILNRKGWTGTELARRASLAPSTVLRLQNDKNHTFVPSLKTIKSIADASNYPIPESVLSTFSDGGDPPEVVESFSARAFSSRRRHTIHHMLPVMAVSSLPKALRPVQQSMQVPCPPSLTDDKTAFACFMNDDALAPFLPHGSTLYASKHRDPKVGDIVVAVINDDRSFVRVVSAIDAKSVELSAPSLDKSITYPWDKVTHLSVVVGHMTN